MPITKSVLNLKFLFILLSLIFSQSIFSASVVGIEVYQEGKQLFLEGKTSKAIKKLKTYYYKNPKGLHADDAIMMIGVGRLKQKNKSFALKAFNIVVNDFPDSEHVAEAQKGIDALSKPKSKPKPKFKPKPKPKQKKTSAQRSNPRVSWTSSSAADLRRKESKLYFKAQGELRSKRYDEAEAIFKQIIATSKNSILVSGSKSHLELIAQGRKKQERDDIEAAFQQQGIEPVNISKISGEDLFPQALKSWSQHQDKETIALLEKYIVQGDSIKRTEDAELLLKSIKKPEAITPANGMAALQRMRDNARENISAAGADYAVLRRVDNNFRSAVENNDEKRMPNDNSYGSFTNHAPEDVVSAFYKRVENYRAFFYGRDTASSSVEQGDAYNTLIQPLSTYFKTNTRKLYDSLIFTMTKNRGYHEANGRELSVAVNVEARGSKVPFENDGQLKGLLKNHLKIFLLSEKFDDVIAVKADYTFYSDYKPYVGMAAEYKKSSWAFSKSDVSSLSALTKPPTKAELQKIADAKLKPRPLSAITGEKRSQKQILALIKPIQKETNALLTEWAQHHNKALSDLDRRGHQSQMVKYARDEMPRLMGGVLNSALLQLQSISSDDVKAYGEWDRELSKPIRKVLGEGLILWDSGFNNGTKSKVNSTFGYSDTYVHAKIAGLISTLMAYQYDWVKKNQIGTTADPDLELPAGISGGKANITYKAPDRIRVRLGSPTELFFGGLGQQAGEGVAAFLTYKGQLAEFERKIKENRKAYFTCYPKCKNFDEISAKFSRLLIEKDVHYLKLAGNYNAFTDRLDRGLSALIETTGSKQGGSLLDGGIPNRCVGEFETWGYYYSQAAHVPVNTQMNNAFSAMEQFAKGNMGAIQKSGKANNQNQQLAFKKTADYYGRYQLCRDQWEFDSWENKHGELDEGSSWFGF